MNKIANVNRKANVIWKDDKIYKLFNTIIK
jgi:hypothetical protein